MPDVQHQTAGHPVGHGPEKGGDRKRAATKIGERRHFQKDEGGIGPVAARLLIHLFLEDGQVLGCHPGGQFRIQRRQVGPEGIPCHLLRRTFVIQPGTPQGEDLRAGLRDPLGPGATVGEVRLRDPQAFAMVRKLHIRQLPPHPLHG